MMDGGAGHAVDHTGVSIKPLSRDSALTIVRDGVPRQARPGYSALAVHHHERLRLHCTEGFPAVLYRKYFGAGDNQRVAGADGLAAGDEFFAVGQCQQVQITYQWVSRSGVAVILWIVRSAPSYSSSGSRRMPTKVFRVP